MEVDPHPDNAIVKPMTGMVRIEAGRRRKRVAVRVMILESTRREPMTMLLVSQTER